MGEQTFADIEAFYADDERRRLSGEMDFGCWWWDGAQGLSGCWQLSVVAATGDVFARRRPLGPDGSEPVLLLGKVEGGGEIIDLPNVSDHFPAAYAEAEELFEGWEQVCGQPKSLAWVRSRVGSEPVVSFLLRATLGGNHVHVVMWAGKTKGSRGRVGELCFDRAEWPVYLDALVAGLGPALEVDLDPELAPDAAAPA